MKSLVNIQLGQTSCFPMLMAMVVSCVITWHSSAAFVSTSTPLITARGSQTATLLSDGRLLVAGGQTNGGFTSSSGEMYDPATGIWALTSSMNADRGHHTGIIFPVLPVSFSANLSNQLSSMLLPSSGPGGVTLTCAGVQGVSYCVQRAPTPAGPWTTISTVTIGESGTGTCLDPDPPIGNACYRATFP